MANKSWLKGAEAHRGQSELEEHRALKWQAPIKKYACEQDELKQRMIQNTRYIYPINGGMGIKKPR